MFADSLVESAGLIHTRTRWTTLFSLCMQTLALGIAVLIPILAPQQALLASATPPSLPLLNLTHRPEQPREHPAQQNQQSQASPNEKPLEMPTEIPRDLPPVNTFVDSEPTQPVCVNCSRDKGVDAREKNVIPGGNSNSTLVVEPVKPHPPLRISMLDVGELLNRVQPVYPIICKQIHCQGAVVLRAIIGRDGAITDLRVVSSAHSLLTRAALDAVRQWRYKPYILNGEKVEVETQITVNFTLGN